MFCDPAPLLYSKAVERTEIAAEYPEGSSPLCLSSLPCTYPSTKGMPAKGSAAGDSSSKTHSSFPVVLRMKAKGSCPQGPTRTDPCFFLLHPLPCLSELPKLPAFAHASSECFSIPSLSSGHFPFGGPGILTPTPSYPCARLPPSSNPVGIPCVLGVSPLNVSILNGRAKPVLFLAKLPRPAPALPH